MRTKIVSVLIIVFCGLSMPALAKEPTTEEMAKALEIYEEANALAKGKEYEKALTLDPMHSDSRTNLAAALARQGKLDRAARELAVLLENDPENAGARTNLGLVFLPQGRAADARRQFEEALRLDPGLTPARAALDSLGHQ